MAFSKGQKSAGVAVASFLLCALFFVEVNQGIQDTVEYIHPTVNLTRVLVEWAICIALLVLIAVVWAKYFHEAPNDAKGTAGRVKDVIQIPAPASAMGLPTLPSSSRYNLRTKPLRK